MIRTADGQPLKILARGDCTSRRSVALNQDLFAKAPVFLQNEKSTFIQFLDAIDGTTVTTDFLRDLSDVDAMPRVLRSFYLGQAGRSILTERDADLLMLDSYADMNFQMWENRDNGFKLWIHPKFVYDLDKFKETHRNIGRRTLQQSVDDAVKLIEYIRTLNPEIPVLFLNQQVDHYPKLADRQAEFAKLGELVAERLPDVYYGGVVAKEDLELADIGSAGGPGNTLHFQGGTYRRMWDRAIAAGLDEAIRKRSHLKASEAPGESPDSRSSGAQSSANKAAQATVPVPTEPAQAPEPGELTFTPSPKRNIVITEVIDIDLQLGSDSCTPVCGRTAENVRKNLGNYFYIDGRTDNGIAPRFTPMLVDLEEFPSFAEWEAHIKKFSKGARLRQKRKAADAGYYTKQYPHRLHLPDVYDINTSMDQRSGGPIRENLTRSLEEMGGAPDRRFEVPELACPRHWRRTFGVFLSEPGHKQGEIQVDERLVGYFSVQRCGEFAIYNQIIGHGDHISKGILTLLHHDVVRHLYDSEAGRGSGLRYIMYGGVQNGGDGLYQFKHQAGFKPYIVNVSP